MSISSANEHPSRRTAPAALSLAQRRRGQWAIIVINALMYCGFFMVIPLVSVHYVEDLGFAAASVGLALATRQLLQQGITLFGGMLADKIGVNGLIAAGVLVRSLGFVSLTWASTPTLLLFSMILSALGGALFDAPSRAAMAALTTEEERATFYARVGVTTGIAMTVGPLIGAQLLHFDFRFVCLAAAACFAMIFFITIWALPPVSVADGQQSAGAGLGMVLRDRTFLWLTALLMGYWCMWVQITLSLPLVAKELSGSSDSVGVIYSLNAGLTVLLQYPLLKFAERHWSPFRLMVGGIALMAFGLGMVAFATSYPLLLLCVVVFALGNIFASPTQQTVTANLSDSRALGSYFGFSALSLAFGGSIGNMAGGWLTDIARAIAMPSLPWLILSSIGLLSAVGLALLGYVLRKQPPPQAV